MKQKIKFSSDFGFTLIETLVTVAIMTAVAGAVLPFLRTFQETKQIEYVAQEIVTMLRTAQLKSSSGAEGSRFGVHFTSGTHELFRGATYSGGEVLESKSLPNTLEIYDIDLYSGSSDVIFEQNSGRTSNTGTLKIRVKELPENHYTVVINALGMARLVKGDYTFSDSAPTAFSLISPANGSTTGTRPFFDWQDSIDPDGGGIYYQILVDDSSDFSSVVLDRANLSSSNYPTQAGELGSSTYYWKVKATDGLLDTWSSETGWSLITAGNPPGAFSLSLPLSGSVQGTLTPTLDWGDSVDPDPGDTVTYTLYIDNNSDFSSPEVTKTGLAGSTYSVVGGDNLQDNTRYYWKVRATDGTSFTWSTETNWYFDITIPEAPGAFSLLSPASGSVQTTTTPSFDWGDSVDPDPGDTVTYTIIADNNSDFSSPLFTHSGLAASAYTAIVGDNLQDNVRYYWKVRATDGVLTTWSTQTNWYFDIAISEPPSAFSLLTPASGSVQTTLTPVLDWANSTDPDPGDTVTYTVIVDNNADFGSPLFTHSGLAASTYTVIAGDNLQDNTRYYWKVSATDGTYTVWSTQTNWYFDTAVSEPPGAFSLISPSNGSTQGSMTPTFDWGDSIDPDPGDTVTYTIIVDNNSDFGSPLFTHSGLAASTYTAIAGDNLTNGTWYWKVSATDGTFTTWSTQTNWSFIIALSDWYVDASVGSSGNGRSWATAFKTITEAVTALASGDTVNIANGTYAESVSLTSTKSGTAGNYTEFINKAGDTNVIIDGTTNSLLLTNADYIRFTGLKFTGAQYGFRTASDSDYVEIINSEIYGNTVYGVYVQHSTCDNMTISSTVVRNNTQYGIYIQGSNHVINNNSQIYSNGSGGIYSDQATGAQIYSSVVRNNTTFGLYFNRGSGATVHHLQVYGNTTYGIYSTRGDTFHFYNNTFYSNTTANLSIDRPATSFVSRNHIMTSSACGFQVTNGSAVLSNNYNDVWNNIANYCNQGSTYQGANSISANPLFVNPGASDFNLQAGSPCINTGDPNVIYNDPNGSRADMGALPTSTP